MRRRREEFTSFWARLQWRFPILIWDRRERKYARRYGAGKRR